MGSMTAIGNSVAPGVADLRTSPAGRTSVSREHVDSSTIQQTVESPMPWVVVPCLPARTFLSDLYNTTTGLLDLYL
jgi:hypothetical protein